MSIIIGWHGHCGTINVVGELTEYLKELVQLSHSYFDRPPSVKIYTNKIFDNVPLYLKYGDFESIVSDIKSKSLSIDYASGDDTIPPKVLLRKAVLNGIEFNLFNLSWFQRNRMSFVFLWCEDLPILDGTLVTIGTRNYHMQKLLSLGDEDLVLYDYIKEEKSRIFLVDHANISLDYFFHGWIDDFLSWIKLFFLPDLVYRGETEFVNNLKNLQKDREKRKKHCFQILLKNFKLEVDNWLDYINDISREVSKVKAPIKKLNYTLMPPNFIKVALKCRRVELTSNNAQCKTNREKLMDLVFKRILTKESINPLREHLHSCSSCCAFLVKVVILRDDMEKVKEEKVKELINMKTFSHCKNVRRKMRTFIASIYSFSTSLSYNYRDLAIEKHINQCQKCLKLKNEYEREFLDVLQRENIKVKWKYGCPFIDPRDQQKIVSSMLWKFEEKKFKYSGHKTTVGRRGRIKFVHTSFGRTKVRKVQCGTNSINAIINSPLILTGEIWYKMEPDLEECRKISAEKNLSLKKVWFKIEEDLNPRYARPPGMLTGIGEIDADIFFELAEKSRERRLRNEELNKFEQDIKNQKNLEQKPIQNNELSQTE